MSEASSLLTDLTDWPGIWTGAGSNHEGEDFDAVFVPRGLFGGLATVFWFRATSMDGAPFHEELGLLAPGPDGALISQHVSTTVPSLLPFGVTQAAGPPQALTFTHAVASGTMFVETIRIERVHDHKIRVGYSWAIPGEEVRLKSVVDLSRVSEPVPDGCPIR